MYIISGIRYASVVIKAPLATARAPLRDDTVHLSVRPFVRPSVPKMRTKAQFSQKLSKIKLWSPTKSPTWAFQKNPLQDPITAPLKFKIADGRYTENSFFVHDSVADCPILVKFCTRKHVTTAIQAAWQKSKFRKFKMADSNHLKNRQIAIPKRKTIRFWWNLVHKCRFGTRWQSRTRPNMKIFKIQDGGRRHIQNRFFWR